MARILVSSNGPHTPTGYGTQSKQIAAALKAAGHEIYFYAWFGLQGGAIGSDGMVMIPKFDHEYGGDAGVIADVFDADLLLTLQDIWVLPDDFAMLSPCPWVAYFPHDGDPMPGAIAERAKTADYPVLFTDHAAKAATEAGLESFDVIPHMVDASTFRVLPDDERDEIRERAGIETDTYVITSVAANKGYPSRKNFPQMLEGVANFRQMNPDAKVILYLHTDHRGSGAISMDQMLQQFGLMDVVRFPDQVRYRLALYTPNDLNAIYNSSDVLLMPSAGEGFGLPYVEAQMSGLEVIGHDCTSLTELTINGSLVPRGTPQYTPLGHYQYLANPLDIARHLTHNYQGWLERGKKRNTDAGRQASAVLARSYSIEAVTPQWVRLIDRVLEA